MLYCININMNKNKAITISIVIVVATIIAAFYILNSGKTNSPVFPNTNQALVALEKQPSKTLKEYSDDAGFSFQYPDDVEVSKIEIKDSVIYSSLELTSNRAKGKILIKIADTKLESVDDWLTEKSVKGNIKEIRIGEISGGQLQTDNKILAAAINQNILFAIEVDIQDQKYWQSVYDTIVASFNFVFQEENVSTETQSLDDSGDAVLEEDIIE